ncbi:hypothetical protein IMCC3317_17900 [Kordia antarctica]|uniref:Uncharacterized protein n=1 Tax=Kordia antarctica TaxID=1218801 RepID=A0A7L4ZIW7_9FLAO|nr:hypothetical protein [Kordia antarctica]QHI36427.1 hypothetical protein IMCC3317_17900 [Kordia antarctica]
MERNKTLGITPKLNLVKGLNKRSSLLKGNMMLYQNSVMNIKQLNFLPFQNLKKNSYLYGSLLKLEDIFKGNITIISIKKPVTYLRHNIIIKPIINLTNKV